MGVATLVMAIMTKSLADNGVGVKEEDRQIMVADINSSAGA